jgi:hypothetical protein
MNAIGALATTTDAGAAVALGLLVVATLGLALLAPVMLSAIFDGRAPGRLRAAAGRYLAALLTLREPPASRG